MLGTSWNDNLAHVAVLLQPATRRAVYAREHIAVEAGHIVRVRVRPNAHGRLLLGHHTYRVTLRLWVSYTPTGGRYRSIGLYGLHLPE